MPARPTGVPPPMFLMRRVRWSLTDAREYTVRVGGGLVDRCVRELEEGGENKRELSRRQQHHHSSTFDCIRSKKKKKKKKKRRRKGQSTFSCRHFPYSASSSRPFYRRLRYIYTELNTYTFITAFDSERIASTTFLLF